MAAKISPLEAGAGAVGIVSAIFGTVKAVAGNGAERILHLGDRVFANELIVTADLSGISIEFSSGGRVDLGRNSEAVLDSDLYGPAEVDRAELVSAVEAAQRAILASADPAAILGAPAAGGGGAGRPLLRGKSATDHRTNRITGRRRAVLRRKVWSCRTPDAAASGLGLLHSSRPIRHRSL